YIPDKAPTPNYYARISNGNGFGPPVDTLVTRATSGHPPFAVDLNHDGRDDAILYVDQYPPAPNAEPVRKPDTPCIARTIGLGGNANFPAFILGPCFPDHRLLGGDLNGDGLSDFLSYVPGGTGWQYWLNQPTGGLAGAISFTGPSDTVLQLLAPNKFELDVVDVDGDGASELIGFSGNLQDTRRSHYELGRAPRDPPERVYEGTLPTGVNIVFGDFNEDGLLDGGALSDFGIAAAYFNTGNGFPDFVSSGIGENVMGPAQAPFYVFDYDADGRADLLFRASTITPDQVAVSDHLVVMQSGGDVFRRAVGLPSQIKDADIGLVQPLDVNGDGLDDLIAWDNGSLLLYKHKGKKPDLLTKITDGLGAV
ncbi:MAG TPA: VCBS repeat-containing protein, partial [Chloroflexota bacterium]|nr:VCBS repeat-containing protein [Chloroflexota bacterium]